IRLGTLNTGLLTGRSMKIVDMLERRRVDICFLQETRWKSNGVSLIGSYKLFWNGQKTAQNGVGIYILDSLAQNVLEVVRISSPLMLIKLRMGKQVFSSCAPQTGEFKNAKNDFWKTLSDAVRKTPSSGIPLICGDLNGHVGDKANEFNGVHGGFGYGSQNEDIIPGKACISQHRLLVADMIMERSRPVTNRMPTKDMETEEPYVQG
ncbi:hypothetical protein HELRODRAFT_63375, partial [Helobdella robusta]|uniref:Endonuclease/exonuclease/phosphatase domain-containing protein n=1 Tax=Helobdella robusta TaxID=6412 RepID=T1FXF0_HELRO